MGSRPWSALVAVVTSWLACLALAAPPAEGAGTGNPAPAAPATRIVTLAPHLAELAYAAGAGSRLVGTVAFSDEPPAARALPRIGDAFRIDYEQLLALRPDLVLAWSSGNPAAVLARLRALGLRVVAFEPTTLDDIGRQVAAIGELAGTQGPADQAAREWAAGLAALRERYRGTRQVAVFYQVSSQPLVTVTDAHFIGQALSLCGGSNVFGSLPGLTAVVGREAVVTARPEVIFVSGPATPGSGPGGGEWQRWGGVPAVAGNRIVAVDPTVMSIPGPRLLAGIGSLCAALAAARG
jgi:ABC-type Fe3+-hydroxamate transport system substrate-binding protein